MGAGVAQVDSIGSARTDNSGGNGDSEVQRTMLELLNQLDGFEETNKIKVRRTRGKGNAASLDEGMASRAARGVSVQGTR